MRRVAWLQERVKVGDLVVAHLPGKRMAADMNTKVPMPIDFNLFMPLIYGINKIATSE